MYCAIMWVDVGRIVLFYFEMPERKSDRDVRDMRNCSDKASRPPRQKGYGG